jgi:hypothetical protein
VIDPNDEDIFPLSRATQQLKSRPSVATVWRWAQRGIRGVTLETVVIGGRRYTSHEAFGRFMHALNAPPTKASPTPSRLRERQKAQAAERATRLF